MAYPRAASLDQMMNQLHRPKAEMALVVKGDVQGSVEAIAQAFMGNEEVSARVVHTGVGGITESDVTLAGASNAWLWALMCAPMGKHAMASGGH